ncbi:ABC transporter ATP-binding protein [Actomonas aquatica]|uniref:ATP-binding cassette domain-containing protein n=1 Tax=Actomonas aquatica TaxID=2866162 RepID=A0ABZ1C2Q7_9BACT|nr:ATP-binding cassette domain-containing protein [Opitutus sp. WL0086]WRQ85640.1 ATP-binding cassette domain-containing protein [Opitutus sp. WL0086]
MSSPDPTSASAPVIVADDLAIGYDGVAIMEQLNFAIASGEIFFVIGGSGCGKSTLLRHLIGLLPPIRGDVQIFGESFIKTTLERRRELLKSFGVLYQGSALWSSLTLAENIMLPLEEYTTLSKRDRLQIARLKLAQVGLTGYDDYYPSEISGGMKKRAGLARALALDPDIVFFDEPSAGLDPITSRELDELILRIRDNHGTTCVIVSHELASIFAIADRVILLDKQARTIIAEGPPKDLAKNSTDPRVQTFLHRGDRPS